MTVAPKILVIDDDELDRKAILRKLRNYNREIECVEATTGEESITALSNDTFDTVLLDYRLAGETGLEVLKALNSHDLLKMPVIMLSGMDDENLILECLENGAQDYLLKNEINSKTLLRSIRYAKERMQLLKQVTALAHFDPLTGLANRSRFYEFLEMALLRAERRNDVLAVLYIDLDHFKDINDTLGHAAGDALLINIADRLKQAVRKTDVVARLGGDEFAIIAENIKIKRNAVPAAEKIIDLLATPYRYDPHVMSISPSIGIALFPECGKSIEDLVQAADTEMYHAKKQGRNNYQFFKSEMHEQVIERVVIENSLRHAIVRNELEVYYQPQIDISTNQPVAMEALLRWDNIALGKISPGTFIPIAEDTGIINSIGTWVLSSACQQSKLWISECRLDVPIMI